MNLRFGLGPTPAGIAFVAMSDKGLCALFLYDDDDPAPGLARLVEEYPGAVPVEDRDAVAGVFPRVAAYLNGDENEGLSLDLSRGTAFQRSVWETLRTIPRGTTRSYGKLARELGRPGAARAVGTACGSNLISVFVPCHRVVRSGGALGGYYWGLDRKRLLLALESEPAMAWNR